MSFSLTNFYFKPTLPLQGGSMSDVTFYMMAAFIGFAGALVSQVLTLQQSLQIKAQTDILEKKKEYYWKVIKELKDERKKYQDHLWDLEKLIGPARDTPEDDTEKDYRGFYNKAEEQRERYEKAIEEWDKRRNDLLNQLYSIQKTNFLSPWYLVILNVIIGALVGWLFGFIEVSTKGAGQAKLTVSLVIEFLFTGAFWPLVWQRIFNTGAVQERVTQAVAKFGVETAAPAAASSS